MSNFEDAMNEFERIAGEIENYKSYADMISQFIQAIKAFIASFISGLK